MHPLLIIGIDPGTTTAITALALSGKLIANISKKNLGQSGIVRTIEKIGNPILIATDISPPPQKVAKVAAAFSVRLIWPKKSLTKSEKIKIFKSYFKKQALPAWNRHQKDSFVAALFAWKAFRPLIAKIDRRLEKYKNQPYFDQLEKYVQREVLLKGQNLDTAVKNFFTKYV
jgi:predicted RNase H-like nuclease (RuvC/YqgF family)